MAHESSLKDTSSNQFNGESSDSSFEIKIKTLDLKKYSFRVNKNMPISALKEEIVTKIGVPLEKQRLLYKGKVLMDNQLLSELNLKDGDTMYLAKREPVQSQSIASAVAADTSRSSSSQANVERGQRRSSSKLSTSSACYSSLSKLLSVRRFAHLLQFAHYRPAPQAPLQLGAIVRSGAGAESSQSRSRTRSANSENFPDALMSVSDFIDRMNEEFQICCNILNNDQHQPLSTNRTSESLNTMEGIPAPEFLGIVLRRTEQLLRGNATRALSNLSTRLQSIDSNYDERLRGDIQLAATYLGFAMLRLGDMFLELGRSTISLNIGQRPGQSFIQARRAVFIAPTLPNPIMVEQFPHQSMHPYGVHYPVHYRQEQSVPIRPPSHFFGSALSTRPPSVSISIPKPEGQITAYRTQSDRSNDGVSGRSENVRVAGDGNQSGSGKNNVSALAASSGVEQQVDLSQVERINLNRDPRNLIGEFFEDIVIRYGEQNVFEDILELSNVLFAHEFMEVMRRYFDRMRAWDYGINGA